MNNSGIIQTKEDAMKRLGLVDYKGGGVIYKGIIQSFDEPRIMTCKSSHELSQAIDWIFTNGNGDYTVLAKPSKNTKLERSDVIPVTVPYESKSLDFQFQGVQETANTRESIKLEVLEEIRRETEKQQLESELAYLRERNAELNTTGEKLGIMMSTILKQIFPTISGEAENAQPIMNGTETAADVSQDELQQSFVDLGEIFGADLPKVVKLLKENPQYQDMIRGMIKE